MNECPCKQCICFAICVSKEEIICDILLGWYREESPSHRNNNRRVLEEVYGKIKLPRITSEDRLIGVTFQWGKKYYEKIGKQRLH